MGETSEISWTTSTFNPWWGCVRVSPACDFCYAEAFAHRLGMDIWGKESARRFFDEKHWSEPLKWERKARESGEPWRVFCASMADVFEDHHSPTPTSFEGSPGSTLDVERARLWTLVEHTPNLTWMLLTKRPENILRMVPPSWLLTIRDAPKLPPFDAPESYPMVSGWPANVWVGTTVENQRYADLRIPKLLAAPATVRFLSLEPLLGSLPSLDLTGISWCIVGGESGNAARPCDEGWLREIRDRCADAGVPLWVKQMGTYWAREHGKRGKADQLADLPQDLRIQEFPQTGAEDVTSAGTGGRGQRPDVQGRQGELAFGG